MTDITREPYIPFRDGLTPAAAANLTPGQVAETIDAYRNALAEAERKIEAQRYAERVLHMERDAAIARAEAAEKDLAALRVLSNGRAALAKEGSSHG
jgi:hypothetical protein